MSNIRDVARAARVSPATVSRVLNNNQIYKITSETRKRVWQAVADLNYQAPVSMARRAEANVPTVAPTVACLLAVTKGKYSDPYYLTILNGMEATFAKRGCQMTFVRTEQELAEPGVLESLLAAPPNGLVIMRPLEEPLFTKLREFIPHIVGIDTGHMPIDNIEYDHRRVSRIAVEYLYAKGHREIGFIGSGTGNVTLERSRRYRGYLETMHDLGLTIHPQWVIDCQWDDELCMQKVKALYAAHPLPDAFYVASDLMAMAALRALYGLGVRVPAEIAVMGMTDIEMSQYANPPLTTIHVPAYEMGEIAANTLADRMAGDRSLPKRIILPGHLVERDSV